MDHTGKTKEELFMNALHDKKIPVLTLDNKWYRLLNELDKTAVTEYTDRLNSLLKRQGKLNNEIKEIKKLKKKLMNEIVPMVDEAGQNSNKGLDKEIEEHKRLIAECNERLESHQDEMLELPGEIEQVNFQLMLKTMEYCYDYMQENTSEINEIAEWVTSIRIELKKRLIHKQEMEQKNFEIYSYMHDIFGAEVVNLFDMKYNPQTQHPKLPGE